ncbi:hypothetical protein IKF67_00270 [Candidatus Saccharibacteria bacterium]|nr:hypothetical protein [Candidatus Saccharibacteria bacterium]
MREDDFSFEEQDDDRTWGDELIPDCEREETVEEEVVPPVLEYLGELKAMIDACGQVSYYYNMRNFIRAEVNKAKVVASAYNHDLLYYKVMYKEWEAKARRSYSILGLHAAKFGYKMPPENDFLNSLALSKDRREAYKDYLVTCLKNEKTLSPAEMEKKFQKRLQRRLKKAQK